MRLEQAVYASSEGGRVKGYHLIAKSDGIDRAMAQELCRWAPSHGALISAAPNAWSLNYFCVDAGHAAIARTTYGGAEYSGRGGMQVVTLFLVIPLEFLAWHENNPVAVARTAMAMGHLRLPSQYSDYSRPVTLPDASLPPIQETTLTSQDDDTLQSTLRLLLENRRVAMVGCEDPIASTGRLISRVPADRRSQISFTTGLTWSMQREFQLQFLPSVDPALRQKMGSQNIVCTAV